MRKIKQQDDIKKFRIWEKDLSTMTFLLREVNPMTISFTSLPAAG